MGHAHRSLHEVLFINDNENEICSDDSSNSEDSVDEDNLYTDEEIESN